MTNDVWAGENFYNFLKWYFFNKLFFSVYNESSLEFFFVFYFRVLLMTVDLYQRLACRNLISFRLFLFDNTMFKWLVIDWFFSSFMVELSVFNNDFNRFAKIFDRYFLYLLFLSENQYNFCSSLTWAVCFDAQYYVFDFFKCLLKFFIQNW